MRSAIYGAMAALGLLAVSAPQAAAQERRDLPTDNGVGVAFTVENDVFVPGMRNEPGKSPSETYLCTSKKSGVVNRGRPPSSVRMPRACASGFLCTSSSKPSSRAMRSRISYMAWNFQVVSTCSSGNGGLDGWKAFAARCSITALSLPME